MSELRKIQQISRTKNLNYKTVSNEIRLLIINSLEKGESLINVSKNFQVKYDTVRSIFNV